MKNPLRHILQKDWRRVRPLTAILAGALLLKAVLLYLVETHFYQGHPIPFNLLSAVDVEDLIHDSHTPSIFYPGIVAIILSDFLALAALIIWLLAEDSPLSERAFWRTRPVTGTQMFLAKAIFIGLAAWPLQAAVQIATSMLAGYPRDQWTDGLEVVVLIQAGVVATVVIAATLWKNVFAGLGAIFLLFLLGVLLRGSHWESADSALVATGLLAVASASAWWMYAYRRRMQGFALLGLGVYCLIFYYRLIA